MQHALVPKLSSLHPAICFQFQPIWICLLHRHLRNTFWRGAHIRPHRQVFSITQFKNVSKTRVSKVFFFFSQGGIGNWQTLKGLLQREVADECIRHKLSYTLMTSGESPLQAEAEPWLTMHSFFYCLFVCFS